MVFRGWTVYDAAALRCARSRFLLGVAASLQLGIGQVVPYLVVGLDVQLDLFAGQGADSGGCG